MYRWTHSDDDYLDHDHVRDYYDDHDDHDLSLTFLHSWTHSGENYLDHIDDDDDDHNGDDYDLGGQEQSQAVCFSTRKVSQKVSTRPIS